MSNHVGIQGFYEEDYFQSHKMESNTYHDVFGTGGPLSTLATAAGTSASKNSLTGVPQTDGTHGTPRAGYITSPARVGHLPIIKYQ